MMAGMKEMPKLHAGSLDSAHTVQWLYCIPPMVLCLPISSWMMSSVMVQKRLWKIVHTTLETIVEAVREQVSFVKLRPFFKQLQLPLLQPQQLHQLQPQQASTSH